MRRILSPVMLTALFAVGCDKVNPGEAHESKRTTEDQPKAEVVADSSSSDAVKADQAKQPAGKKSAPVLHLSWPARPTAKPQPESDAEPLELPAPTAPEAPAPSDEQKAEDLPPSEFCFEGEFYELCEAFLNAQQNHAAESEESIPVEAFKGFVLSCETIDVAEPIYGHMTLTLTDSETGEDMDWIYVDTSCANPTISVEGLDSDNLDHAYQIRATKILDGDKRRVFAGETTFVSGQEDVLLVLTPKEQATATVIDIVTLGE